MITLFKPYVSDLAKANVQRVLSGTQLAQGPEVDLLEKEIAMQFGLYPWQVVAVNSGTSALELAYFMCDLWDSHVIAPVLTCTATNIPLERQHIDFTFADVRGRSCLNICPEDVERKMLMKTKAVVFVHFGGSSCGLHDIERICEENNVDLICDAAQALGAKLSRKARFNCISLQAIKTITSGDGGFIICRDKEDADMARKLRWFGYDREKKQREGDCDLEIAGFKFHMNDITAAMARGNLDEWESIYSHRRKINDIYAMYGAGKGLIEGIWNPVVVGINYEEMKPHTYNAGFEIGQYHYRNDKYSVFADVPSDCPNMDQIDGHYFMLPCHLGMTEDDAHLIGSTIWPQEQ